MIKMVRKHLARKKIVIQDEDFLEEVAVRVDPSE